MLNIRDKVIPITGASSGIGAACAVEQPVDVDVSELIVRLSANPY